MCLTPIQTDPTATLLMGVPEDPVAGRAGNSTQRAMPDSESVEVVSDQRSRLRSGTGGVMAVMNVVKVRERAVKQSRKVSESFF